MKNFYALLKTREVARALGVSVSTVKRWVDAGALQAARTVGKHRLIPVSDALRLAREQGLPHTDLQRFEQYGVVAQSPNDDRLRATLADALVRGDSSAAR